MPCHGAHHLLNHEYILYLGHFRHQYFTPSQIAHLTLVAPVTVNYSEGVKIMEAPQTVERARRLYHTITSPQRLHGIFLEYQRIQLGIYRIHTVTLDEKHRLTRTENSKINLLAYAVGRR